MTSATKRAREWTCTGHCRRTGPTLRTPHTNLTDSPLCRIRLDKGVEEFRHSMVSRARILALSPRRRHVRVQAGPCQDNLEGIRPSGGTHHDDLCTFAGEQQLE